MWLIEVLPFSRLTMPLDGFHDRYLSGSPQPTVAKIRRTIVRLFVVVSTGELEGGNPGWRMERPACVNVRSQDCADAGGHMRSVVHYRGEEYSVIGLYFAHGPKGRLELHYVLSTLQDRLQLSERTN